MSFKRKKSAPKYSSGLSLTKKLIGIGFKISGKKELNPNIEDTLIAALIEGINGDFRLLSLLTDWIFLHHKAINIDRLFLALTDLKNIKANIYFSSVFQSLKNEKRAKKIIDLYKGDRCFLDEKKSYAFLVNRNGEDERFVATKLIVAKGSLRVRPEDIASKKEMMSLHKDYYFRTLLGPCFRADMISLFLREKEISPSDLAHRCYGSYATAWEVFDDFKCLKEPLF